MSKHLSDSNKRVTGVLTIDGQHPVLRPAHTFSLSHYSWTTCSESYAISLSLAAFKSTMRPTNERYKPCATLHATRKDTGQCLISIRKYHSHAVSVPTMHVYMYKALMRLYRSMQQNIRWAYHLLRIDRWWIVSSHQNFLNSPPACPSLSILTSYSEHPEYNYWPGWIFHRRGYSVKAKHKPILSYQSHFLFQSHSLTFDAMQLQWEASSLHKDIAAI